MIRFCSNATGWDPDTKALVPGGMTDRMIGPILDHLDRYQVERLPKAGALNAYLSMPSIYFGAFQPGGVLISHGIADKQIRVGSKLGESFAYVVVPGPAYARRLAAAGVPEARIVELGYPKLDPLFRSQVNRHESSDRIRVVWAPTHGGGGEQLHGNDTAPPRMRAARVTSWWRRDEVLKLLDRPEFDVIEAPHPRHRPDGRATFEEYIGADVVVADGGSTIYEAWALSIPVVFPTWLTGRANLDRSATFESQIYRQGLGFHAMHGPQLPQLVEQAAKQGMTEREVDFIDEIFPPAYRGKSGQLHAEFLTEVDRRRT